MPAKNIDDPLWMYSNLLLQSWTDPQAFHSSVKESCIILLRPQLSPNLQRLETSPKATITAVIVLNSCFI